MPGKSMKRFDLVIPSKARRKFYIVEAYETPTAGLFVHRDLEDRYRWAVTHWSGILVGDYEWESRDEAIAFAEELADILEWHRPIDRVREQWDQEDIRQAVKTARIRVAGARDDATGLETDSGTVEGPEASESAAQGVGS